MDGWGEQTLFTRGPVVIFAWRNEAGWPVDSVSPNVGEVLGYAPEAFLTHTISYGDIVVAEDATRVAEEVRAATLAGHHSFEHEPYRVRHNDGTLRWLHDFTHVIRNAAGEATHYVGYIFDITRRITAEAEARKLEHQLFHAQKLESLGVLAGGVAHDFSNLLTGMLGQLTLARRIAPAEPPRLNHYLEQIERLALQAAGLTNQLLAYSGKGNFVVEPTDLNALINEMAQMLGIVIPRRATVTKDLGQPLPPVMADRIQLQQVVMNLLSNAAEALGEESGTITVRTSTRDFTAQHLSHMQGADDARPGSYIVVEIIDSGCGMDEATQKRLFEPFFTTKFAGRGLGMSAVLGIVRSHQGAISVNSKLGSGTTFTVLLPTMNDAPSQETLAATRGVAPTAPGPNTTTQADDRRAPGLAKGSMPQPALNASAKPTVLVVDDDHMLRTTAAELIEHMGFATLQAKSGAQALELYDQHAAEISLVVLDLTMPVMPGEEVLAALRSRTPTLPVILSSGYSQQEAIRRTGNIPLLAGPLLFLKKPYRLVEFEELVHRALQLPRPKA